VHHCLDFGQPELDCTLSDDWLRELDDFALGTDHGENFVTSFLRRKLDFDHSIEAFAQVRLHCLRITSLGQDFEQITVRQEVETRETATLIFEILRKAVLDFVKNTVVPLEPREQRHPFGIGPNEFAISYLIR
jgi:hypothetical protein